MKIYGKQNVWDAAIERIEWLYEEFGQICICFSGGKDSTVALEMTLIVARKLGKLPLKVFFLDQEAEWQSTIDYVEEVMARPEIEPIWVQTPIFMPNSVSQETPFLIAWEDGKDDEWMRPKSDLVYKGDFELIPEGVDRPKEGYWYEYFHRSARLIFGDEAGAFIVGIRAQESPNRATAIAKGVTYKWATWGKQHNPRYDQYSFYPLYDWLTSDIWKAIHDNGWNYCKIYDEFYRYGISPHKMRVSNLTHESAVQSLFYLQEIEGNTWEKLTLRLGGINQAKHLQKEEMLTVKTVPPMFSGWKEYRDYLTEKLINEEKYRDMFKKAWARHDVFYAELRDPVALYRNQIKSVLVNDHELAKLQPFLATAPMINYRKWVQGGLWDEYRDPAGLTQIKIEYLENKIEGKDVIGKSLRSYEAQVQ